MKRKGSQGEEKPEEFLIARAALACDSHEGPSGEVSCPARRHAAPALWFTCMALRGQARLSQRPLPGSP